MALFAVVAVLAVFCAVCSSQTLDSVRECKMKAFKECSKQCTNEVPAEKRSGLQQCVALDQGPMADMDKCLSSEGVTQCFKPKKHGKHGKKPGFGSASKESKEKQDLLAGMGSFGPPKSKSSSSSEEKKPGFAGLGSFGPQDKMDGMDSGFGSDPFGAPGGSSPFGAGPKKGGRKGPKGPAHQAFKAFFQCQDKCMKSQPKCDDGCSKPDQTTKAAMRKCKQTTMSQKGTPPPMFQCLDKLATSGNSGSDAAFPPAFGGNVPNFPNMPNNNNINSMPDINNIMPQMPSITA